jgi:hypothetical protein
LRCKNSPRCPASILSTSETQQLVSEVNGTKSGNRQAAMVKNIEATAYIDRIRELAGGITIKGPGRERGSKPRLGMAFGVTGSIAGGPDQLGVAVPGTRTAGRGAAVSRRSRADAGAGRKARLRDGVRGRIGGSAYELLADDELHGNEASTGTLDGLRPRSARRCAQVGDGPTG